MNDFKIIREIGVGVQGKTFLAIEKRTNKECCIKEIECKDDESAQETFNEMKEIAKVLNSEKSSVIHPFCLFIQWHESVTTFLYYQVTPYYKRGDFKNLMLAQYNKKEALKEERIEQWTGEIIEIMQFLNLKKICHKSVRPSNFLLDEQDRVFLTDICTVPVMKDVQVKTRSSTGCMTFMAPEIVTRKTGPSSDTDFWSAGAVIMGLMVSHLVAYDQFTSYIIELKFNKKALVHLFERLLEFYSMELITAVRDMLHPRRRERLTLGRLSTSPHLQSILEGISEKRNQIIEGVFVPLGTDQPFKYYTDYLSKNFASRACFRAVMEFLNDNISDGWSLFSLDSKECTDFIVFATHHADSLALCEITIKIVGIQVIGLGPESSFYSEGTLSKICRIALKYPESYEVQSATAKIILASKRNGNGDELKNLLHRLKVVELLVAMLGTFKDNATIVLYVFKALWPLMLHEGIRQDLCCLEATDLVVNIMDTYKKEASIFEEGCLLIFGLSLLDKAVADLNQSDMIPVLVHGLLAHQGNVKVIINCCNALASMVDAEEESSYILAQIHSSEGDIKGIDLLASLWSAHMDNYVVAETICRVVYSLTRHEGITSEIKCGRVAAVVNDMSYAYIDRYDFRRMCVEILERVHNLKAAVHT